MKRLPAGATLKEAVDVLKKRSPESMEQKTVREVADDLLKAKRAAKFSDVHFRDLESRLNRISKDFKMVITFEYAACPRASLLAAATPQSADNHRADVPPKVPSAFSLTVLPLA